jgi:hypothetical protein
VEVGQQSLDDTKLESWDDDEIRLAAAGLDDLLSSMSSLPRRRFQGSGCRRADGHDATALGEREIDGGRNRGIDFIAFRVDPMVFDTLNTNGLKRPVTDVQREG